MNKKYLSLLLPVLCLLTLFTGCGGKDAETPSDETPQATTVTDYYGHTVTFDTCPQRVAAVSGSLGEVWLDAGGTLIGVTQDALAEHQLGLPEDTAILGTIKGPNLELLLSLEPDFVILSADIASHQALADTLREMNIPCGQFHEELFQDYLALLAQFTAITGREDLYQTNGLDGQTKIAEILETSRLEEPRTALLIRAYSSGFKAKGSDILAGAMLADFGFVNVLDQYDSLLEDISLEEIIRVDPDAIFITTMGSDTQAALDNLSRTLESNPAWSSLTAIENGQYFVLPKELFHYKPNARWPDAYQYIADLLSAS